MFDATRMYELAQRTYSAIPYKYFKNGYAFPCWHYYFEVTRRCNLRCKMCVFIDWLENTQPSKQKEDELTTEEWCRVIDQVGRFSFVTFTGGEPFVRKDFLDLITRASRKARTHLISNATMLTEDRAEALVALAPKRLGGRGFNFMGTSIEAPGGLHDEIRQLPGAYERTLNGIHMLRTFRDQAGKPCPKVHVTTVLQQDNVQALHFLPKALKDAGVDVMNLVTETRMFSLPDLGEVDPASFKGEQIPWPKIDRRQLADALNQTIANAEEAGIEIRLPRMPREAILDYYDQGLRLDEFECRNAWNTLFVGRQGHVYPCWIKKIGNVRDNTIKELWNNAAMRDFRKACQKGVFAMCPGCCFLEHKSDRDAVGQ
jgi:radical SAM protein with 4Fe4S-binding SPASM domain